MTKPITHKKQIMIKRRAAVESMLVRGKTLEEMQVMFANSRISQKVKDKNRIYNEVDNSAWSLAILGRDKKHIEERWLGGADLAVQKAMAEKEIDEAKAIAFSKSDSRAILLANKARRDLFGLDAPKRTDITSDGEKIKGYAIVSPDDFDAAD